MKSKFTVKDRKYELALEKGERGEEDKFHPFTATVTGQEGGAVRGICQLTDRALEAANEKAKGDASAADVLAAACGKSIASELVIRKLKPDFSFVVDYRWL